MIVSELPRDRTAGGPTADEAHQRPEQRRPNERIASVNANVEALRLDTNLGVREAVRRRSKLKGAILASSDKRGKSAQPRFGESGIEWPRLTNGDDLVFEPHARIMPVLARS